MRSSLRDAVLEANTALFRSGLATFTFGNASAIDRDAGQVVIKPSGMAYTDLHVDWW
jgi:L-ribulose-5-phosphate 4-epimerase